MTQYVSNPTPKTSLTGWSKSSGALTATSAGARWVSGGGEVTVEVPEPGHNTDLRLAGMRIKRNTAASKWPAKVFIWSEGRRAGMQMDLRDVDFPVGTWITLPTIGVRNSVDTYENPTGPDYVIDIARVYIMGPESGSLDITIDHVTVYDDAVNDGPIDANDASFTHSGADNSQARVFSRSPGDEAVASVKWTWGDGTTTSGPAAGTGQVATGRSKTFPAPGVYSVKLESTSPPRAIYPGFGDPIIPVPAAVTVSTTQAVTVPVGTFEARYRYETDYLNVVVDGSDSVAPDLSPIDTYAWNWGDGSTTAANPSAYASHTYAQPGSYNVTLTVRDTATQRVATLVKTIDAVAAPNPDNYFVSHHELLTVDFTPSITDGTSYSWQFGDGATSTTKTPTHTYAIPGTYNVTLTVNGTLTTTQQIVVSAKYEQLGNLLDAMRLEVSVPHPAGTIFNRLSNPSGELGAFGWVTPVANSYLVGSTTANTSGDKGVAGAKLIYRSSGAGTQVIYSEAARVVPGQYVSAQWQIPYVDGYARFTVEALDAAGAVLGSSATTGYLSGSLTAVSRTTAYLLPAGTVTARLRVNHYSTTAAGTPTVGKLLQLRQVMLATAPTAAALTANPYVEGVEWRDLLGPTGSIEINRSALNLGTFSALVLDSTYDPATDGTIRPGQGIRLRVAASDAFGNVTYESLFTGTVDDTPVEYRGSKGSRPAAKSTRITITATDATKPLSKSGQPGGVSKISELPQLLEGVGVPFEVNGSSGQVPAAQVVSLNDNASVLDQIAIARDSSGGYASVNRNNVLIARDPEHMPTVPAGEIDERAYSYVDASFATDECMNSITIKWLRTTGDQTEEITYGPYVDQASVDEWGLRPATFTMHGVENPTAIAAKAAAILTANSQPERRINRVRMPIRYVEDLTPGKALLDLYDLVRLGYERTGTDELARVTSIKHTITPKRWTMELGFSPDGSVAPPQVVASPPPAAQIADGTAASIDTAWSANAAGEAESQQIAPGVFCVTLQSLIRTAALTPVAATGDVNPDETICTVDAAHRPLQTRYGTVTANGLHTVLIAITTTGLVRLLAFPSKPSAAFTPVLSGTFVYPA